NSRRPLANEFEVFVGSRCPNPYRCTIPWVKAGHVYYHDAFDECSLENDIAIVELAGNVLNTFASPICLPDRSQPIARVLKVAGSADAGRPDLWPVGQQVVTVTFVQLDNNFIRVKPLPGMGICPGDSGGPLFQFNGLNQNTVIGLTSYVTSCFQREVGGNVVVPLAGVVCEGPPGVVLLFEGTGKAKCGASRAMNLGGAPYSIRHHVIEKMPAISLTRV
ncbi:trypsin, partial [Teladorsagia circumcincta]